MVGRTLRSLRAESRPAGPPERGWRDWALVGALLTSAVVEVALREDVTWGPGRVAVVALLAICLLLRREHPLGVVAIMFTVVSTLGAASLLGVDTSNHELGSYVWVIVLPYSLLRWASGSECAIGVAIVLVSGALGVAADAPPPEEAVAGLVFLLFPAALAASTRYRATARRREIEQVKLREREQIARELHDSVAHHVSAIAIQAQAGQAVAVAAPDRAVEALRVIEEAASRTLAEMRVMVGVLREGDAAAFAPQPGVTDIPALANGDGGRPRIEVALSGDLEGLRPTVDAALYRLAQESVTNAVRHARHATRVEVHVEGDADRIRLTVRDDGDARPVDLDARTGYGLIGMTERATLLGGTLHAGPDHDRGWSVHVSLPRTGAVA